MPYRYFFALMPEPEVSDATMRAATKIQRDLSLRGRQIARHRIHMTWSFIGRYTEPRIDVEEAGVAVGDAVKCAPFEIAFDHATSFGRGEGDAPCVFIAPHVPAEMMRIATHLRKTLEDAEVAGRDDFPFRPHVTWLYSPDRIKGAMRIDPIVWRATEMCLVQSTSGVLAYRIIKRWPLDGS
jgi:RNA 2',3'-cyclic 3'-phosphodiesterase